MRAAASSAVEHAQQVRPHGPLVAEVDTDGHVPVLWRAERDVGADVAVAVALGDQGPVGDLRQHRSVADQPREVGMAGVAQPTRA
jgi:hypothetical protein